MKPGPSHPVSIQRSQQPGWIIPLVVLLLASLACALPGMGDLFPKATPVPLSTDVAQLQATLAAPPPGGDPIPAATLPPALVEVSPLPRSELAAGSAPTFFFNQPMERASVEAAFRAEPAVPGRFEWTDDATLRFLPDQALAPDTSLTLTINTGARAASGTALADPIQVSYQAPGPLMVVERLPAPDTQEANPSSAVVVTFNQPMVDLSAEMASAPPAFTLDPPADGRGEWLNTSTYIYYPQPALMGGAHYTVRLAPDLRSSAGAPLNEQVLSEWGFDTAQPALMQVQPSTEIPLLLDSDFVLTFNQPMDRPSVEDNFTLMDAAGQTVAGTFAWNEVGTELTFTPETLLARSTGYTLILIGAAASQGGAPLGQDFAAQLSTVSPLSVLQTRPFAGEKLEISGGYASAVLTFSAPLAHGQDLEGLLSVTPALTNPSIYLSEDDFKLFITGSFQPSTNYELRVSPDLRDAWNGTLGAGFVYSFSTQAAQPSLVIPVSEYSGAPVMFVPQSETEVQAQSVNVSRVTFSRGRLDLNEFIQAAQNYEGLPDWQSRVQATWVRLYFPNLNKVEPVNLPLTQEKDQLLAPGLYFWQVDPAIPAEPARTPGLVVVSPIQMAIKVSDRQAFVWAISLNGDKPLPDTLVTFYDNTASELGTCATDAQGVCQTEIPVRNENFQPVYAVIGQPGDPNFSLAASTWGTSVSPWSFNLPYENKGDRPEIYLYTDRPLYQPGQAVNLRAVVRSQDNGRYARTDLTQVSVEVIGPFNALTGAAPVIDTIPLPLTVYGSGSGVYRLPDDATLGTYTLRVVEQLYTDLYFDVAAYRKPEIELSVNFSKPDQLTGSDLQAQVQASYYFGAPAGSLPVRWVLYSRAENMRFPGELSNLVIGKRDSYWYSVEPPPGGDLGAYLMEGTAQTGPDGSLTIAIQGDDLRDRLDADRTLNLTLEVTAEDESGLPVSARGAARLHPSAIYIGIRAESWMVSAGQSITYFVRTLDWQGNPVADIDLTAHFRKVNWVRDELNAEQTGSFYRPEYADAGSTDFRTSDQGEARLAFVPTEPGTFQLDVTAAGQAPPSVDDQPASPGGPLTQDMLWVGGESSSVTWPNLTNNHLLLRSDASSYQPDQIARIFIPNPYPQGAQALVTVERGRVMRSSVQTITGASYELELPLLAEDAPNVYVSVLLMGREQGSPAFSMGYLSLPVAPVAQILQVEVETSPQQAQPGGSLTLNVRVKDAAGNPVQGEFSLALVDKAVLALHEPNSPGIVEAFYGQQPLGVMNGLSLAVYSGRFVVPGLGRGGGGGGDASVVSPAVREKFEDTAYWTGALETDVNGVAQVTVTLPDNLTTWRADVRGLTVDTRVGEAQAEVVTSKPLLIRPVAPRFVVMGDHLELSAVVHNNTTDPLQAQAGLEAVGFELDDPAMAVQKFDLPAGERRQVSWWGTVQDAQALDLLFNTQAGSLRDAARPAGGQVPVLRYAAPQTYGTAGILTEAGQRLESVSLPRSFTPQGGELRLELAPSLAAVVLDSLQALQAYPDDFTEPVLSRLLPNLAAYSALKDLGLANAELQSELETNIQDGLARLLRVQNPDGGWGWTIAQPSDSYISAYVLFGLNRVQQASLVLDPQVIAHAQDYLAAQLLQPNEISQPWELDRLSFQSYTLQQSGWTPPDLETLFTYREKLSPWGKALLALTLDGAVPGDARARTLLSDLQAAASRSATGVNWQDPGSTWQNWSTPGFTTSVVVYALARLDPAAEVLSGALRYLILTRQPEGAWASSYESAWTLLALVEAMRGAGDLQASFTYAAGLNGSPLIKGQADGPASALAPVSAQLDLADLLADQPNALLIERGEGGGRLYYSAYLRVERPAEEAQPVQRGLTITRAYYPTGQNCRQEACHPLEFIDLATPAPVSVRLTLTLPEDMPYLMVEDYFPAGAEVLNPRLTTTQLGDPLAVGEDEAQPLFAPDDPFAAGWGWWYFADPQISASRIRWVASFVPAGTYQLTYRLTPFLPGQFRLLPAHAWQYYFPEVEATSAGQIIEIK